MKICSISDTHGLDFSFVSKCDILTHSGDFSPCFRGMQDVESQRLYLFNEFIPKVTSIAKHTIFIGGNHDRFLDKIFKAGEEEKFRKSLPENVYYLRDSGVTIEGIKLWGVPWTTKFLNWYFMGNDCEESLGKYYSQIPEGLDILLTHGPAYGYNDRVENPVYMSQDRTQHLGSRTLLKHIKRAKPRFLMAGHIHTGEHKPLKILWNPNDLNGFTISQNVSILDEQYEPTYTEVCTKEL